MSIEWEQDPSGSRRCYFCGRSGPLTKEHVIPRWLVHVLNELEVGYPGPEWGLHYTAGGVVERDRQHPVSDPTVFVRHVCRDCNGGWMSLLETAVMSKLGAMVRGYAVSLDPREQLAIATWASKTSMVMETHEPSMVVTTEADRQLIAAESRPPNHHRVRLTRRAEVWESLMIKNMTARSVRASTPGPDAFVTMFAIGCLIVEVWGGHGSPNNDEPLGVGSRTDRTVTVWPPNSTEIRWPPPRALAEDEMDQSVRELLTWADESPDLATWRQSRRDLRPKEA